MPTGTSTPKKSPAKRTAKPAGEKDAIALLKADHREVEGLFSQFEKTKDDAKKGEIAAKICAALKVHTQIEEEIFYPAARDAFTDKQEDMVDEAVVEHAGAKQLIAEIETMKPGEDLYDAKVKVLSEQIEHHVEEEEKEFFPAAQKTEMDMDALGARMAARKQELMRAASGQRAKPH